MTYLPAPVPSAFNAQQSRAMVQIAIVNESSAVSDAEVRNAMAALQIQISRDLAPIWHTDAHLTFFSSADRTKVPPAYWWMVILDTSDVAHALGYHDLSPTGMPMGKVFAKTAKDAGLSWTVTLSHEVTEQLVDPYVNTSVFVQDSNTTGTIYGYEVGDPVENDRYGYMINGVLMSDFITPYWFASPLPAGAKYDFTGHLTSPLSLMPGGYVSVFDVTGGGWSQRNAESLPMPARPGSRFERRIAGPGNWVGSERQG
jgi:hypothetical protein